MNPVTSIFTGTRGNPPTRPPTQPQPSSHLASSQLPPQPQTADSHQQATDGAAKSPKSASCAPSTPQPHPWPSARAPKAEVCSRRPQHHAVATPLAAAGKKRPYSATDVVPDALPAAPATEPLHKRRRLPTRSRHTLDHFSFPAVIGNNQPPSPLFFSNSRKARPRLPARFSSSEAAARMLSKTHGEESVIKTVTLARGTFTGISPPGVASLPSTRGSDRSSIARTSPSSGKERSEPLRLLGSVGIVELLETDTRPTFIVDLSEASNHTPGSANLHILFANAALRSRPSLWELVASGPLDSASEDGSSRAREHFNAWLLQSEATDHMRGTDPPPVEHGGLVWSCFTVRRRLRVVAASLPLGASADVTSTDKTHAFVLHSSPLAHFSNNGLDTILPATGRSDDQDYFGSSATVSLDATVSSPTAKTADLPEGAALPSGDRVGLAPKPDMESMCVREDNRPASPYGYDVGFFDWTRLPLDSSLPRHIQFARSIDWASTPLGPIEFWTNDLRAMCNLIMASPHPAAMYWGDELVAIYNEAYIGLAGQKHPQLMGQSYKEAWAEIWDDVKDVFANARITGQATMKDDDCLFMKRNGFLEETYFSWSIIPMVGENGTVMGLYNPAFEKTRRKIAERRMLTLREVGERTAIARDVKSFWTKVLEGVTENEYDTPFALLYSVSDDNESDCSSLHSASLLGNKMCYLEGSLGVPPNHPCAPESFDLKEGNDGFGPVFREVMKTDKPVVLGIGSGDLPWEMMEGLHWRGFGDACRDVVVCPIHPTTGEVILGFLVVGVNPRRPFDDDYNLFIQLLGRQLGTSLASVVLFEEEIRRGQRAARLAAEDRFNLSEQLAARTQEARDSETRFTRMAEYSPAGLFIANHEGRITYCNDAWYEITRVPKEPLKTDNWIEFVKEEDQWIVREHWKALVENAHAINIEFRFKTPWEDRSGNKTDTWVLFSAFPETYEEGKLKSIFGSLTNISPQKWAEDFQKRKTEEAVELKRQQENFIDITSHEMRNPLSAILQCADEIATILSDFRSSDTAKIPPSVVADSIDAAQTIALCAQHQKRIVDDVLTLSKLDSAMLIVTPVDAQPLQVVQRALKMFEGEVQTAGIEMDFVVSDSFKNMDIDWVKLDPSRVLQVLINLTTNAIKFTTTEPKRTIRVLLSASKERFSASKNPLVQYFPYRSKQTSEPLGPDWGNGEEIFLEFAVQDTGRGLTEEEKKLLFQRFSQASPRTHVQYGGSGLGLFISRELTELQGGEIGVSSEAGKGSTFAFYVKCRKTSKPAAPTDSLPLALTRPLSNSKSLRNAGAKIRDFASSTQKNGPSHSRQANNASLKVLVVEDNIVNQRVLQRQLRYEGVTVFVANHGGEALDRLKESWYWKKNSPDAPDVGVVLMDKEMPVMDGLACTSQIREWEKEGMLRSHIPIIAVTANARSEQVAMLMDAGMDDVVSKPFRIAELLPKIKELAARYPNGFVDAQSTNSVPRSAST